MNGSIEQKIYRKGENLVVDRKLERYRKMRLWRGNAINEVFNDEEFNAFAELWRKEGQGLQKLTVNEVSKLLEFADDIIAWREVAQRESSRKRMDRSRKKLRKKAKNGDSVAIRKIERVKKSAKKRWAKCYKRKRGKKAV